MGSVQEGFVCCILNSLKFEAMELEPTVSDLFQMSIIS